LGGGTLGVTGSGGAGLATGCSTLGAIAWVGAGALGLGVGVGGVITGFSTNRLIGAMNW
jgi:hypothetical protein